MTNNNIKGFIKYYDFSSKINKITLLRSTDFNDVYLLETKDKDKKILRISKKLNVEDIEFELEAIDFLKREGLKTPSFLINSSKVGFVNMKNFEIGVVFEYVEGSHAINESNRYISDKLSRKAGVALANLHKIGINFEPKRKKTKDIFSEFNQVIKNKDYFEKRFLNGKEFIKDVEATLRFLKKNINKELAGFIHNDFRPGNLIFDDKNNVKSIIDFDWCCIGPLVWDLALGALEWSFPDKTPQPSKENLNSFIQGYNKISAQDIKIDEYFVGWIMSAALDSASTYILRKNNPKNRVIKSYMYEKFKYFEKYHHESLSI